MFVGGGLGAQRTAQIFRPDAGWGLNLPLLQPRSSLMTSILPSGEVILLASADDAGNPTETGEMYDPSTPSLLAGTPLTVSRANGVAVTVPADQSILLIGGLQSGVPLSGTDRLSYGATSG